MKKSYTLIIIILCLILACIIGFGIYKFNDNKESINEIVEDEETNKETSTGVEEKLEIINFDDYYEIAYDETIFLQEKVDANYLVGAYGDYYHHNTEDFLKLFWLLDETKEIIIDGKSYSFVEYTKATLQNNDGSIKMEDGSIVEYNNRTEIITCEAEEDNPARFVAILKEK